MHHSAIATGPNPDSGKSHCGEYNQRLKYDRMQHTVRGHGWASLWSAISMPVGASFLADGRGLNQGNLLNQVDSLWCGEMGPAHFIAPQTWTGDTVWCDAGLVSDCVYSPQYP